MDDTFKGGETENAAALHAGRMLEAQRAALEGEIHQVMDGLPWRVARGGEFVPVEHLLAAPVARRGAIVVRDASSFVAAVNRFKDPGSMIFIDEAEDQVTCVVDHHLPGEDGSRARWGRFRIVLQAKTTAEWELWNASSGQKMNQAAFAQFLEDHVQDIAAPPGGEIVEMARTFEAKKDVQFHSVIRAADGSVDCAYREDVQGTMRGGDFKVPDRFTLGIAPYEGVNQFSVLARLRYRLEAGRLSLSYDLLQTDLIARVAFKEITDGIAAGVPDVLAVNGPAPPAQLPV